MLNSAGAIQLCILYIYKITYSSPLKKKKKKLIISHSQNGSALWDTVCHTVFSPVCCTFWKMSSRYTEHLHMWHNITMIHISKIV